MDSTPRPATEGRAQGSADPVGCHRCDRCDRVATPLLAARRRNALRPKLQPDAALEQARPLGFTVGSLPHGCQHFLYELQFPGGSDQHVVQCL